MSESVWKKFWLVDDSVVESKAWNKSSALNFSKWFTYQEQDLNNVKSTPEELKKSNRMRTEKYIGEKIPTKKMNDEEIDSYFKWLTAEQAKWIYNKANTNEFDQNTLVAYVNHRDEWKNPNAEWTWMFEKKGSSSWDSSYWKPLWRTAWALWGSEVVWRSMSAIWNYQFNRTMDKYLPEDVSRLTRYTKYEKVPNVLSQKLAETNEQIEKAEKRLGKSMKNKLLNWWVNDETRRNLEELYARRDAINDALKAMEDTKQKLPSEKPETARETAKRMNLKWNDLRAAWQAATTSSVYYTTEIAPLYKQVKARFNMWDIFDSLTKDDFPWLTESEWQDMKNVINKEKSAYSKYTDMSAEELHKKLSDFDLSKQRIKWEESKWLNAQFKDAVHTKINNLLDDAVERELPWQSIKNKKLVYNNMLNIENELKDYAVSWWKRKSQTMLKDLRDSTTRSIKIKRWLWTNLRKAWDAITPTKQAAKLVDKVKNLISKLKSTATVATEKTVEAVNPKNLIDPKNFNQPKLLWNEPVQTLQLLEWLWWLWDSMLWWWTNVWDIAEKIWEIPAVNAANVNDDLLWTSYQWSLLSEEEKPYYMQEILEEIYPWETFTIEEAEELYKQLKENWSIYLWWRMSA